MGNISLTLVISIISAATSGVFAFFVMRRWWEKRRPHLLAWGIGLILYFIGTLSQVILYYTWSPLFFGLWYWCGALMVAPWLGQGTIYLLVRRGSIARNVQMALILVGVMTLPWVLFLTPFNEAAWQPHHDITEVYKTEGDPATGVITKEGILSLQSRGTVRFFSPIMNVWGTIALVGGAIYSAHLFRRKQIMRNRVVGNWLIALGGLMPALGGVLIRLGDPSYKYLGEMLGAILIFVGFLMTTNHSAEMEQPRRTPGEPVVEAAGSGD
ncbi:MAG TPA: hypothetical protein VHL11_14370 [Phototrophicaceae bacterium]|jgi:hypothetical protein|nr:hypothetical protein [Phototrophicaceae bacterium]